MRAVLLDQGKLTLADRPSPTRSGECLIRVIAAGICGTDLELLRGYAGFSGVPGHEFVGVVEDAPDADRTWIGRRVAGEITVGCEQCPSCRAAGRGHCDVRTVLGIIGRDGAFAEYLSLPATNLHAIPDAIDDVTAVFVEPLAAACRILEQVRIEPGMRAAVVGAGRLGLLVAQVLRGAGASVTVIVRSDRGQAAASRVGFDVLAATDVAGASRRFDLAADVTGGAAGFALAGALVRPRGTVVVKSTFHGETTIAFAPLVVDEISIVGSRCGPFAAAVKLLEAGSIDLQPWPRETYTFDRHDEAFRRAAEGVKVILRP